MDSFHSFSTTAISSATSEHGTNPECRSGNQEQSCRNKEQNEHTPSSSLHTPQMKRSELTGIFEQKFEIFIVIQSYDFSENF